MTSTTTLFQGRKWIADSELSQKHGLVQAVWLTVAMAVAAKREPVMVTEGVASGWETVDGTGQTRGGREDRDLHDEV